MNILKKILCLGLLIFSGNMMPISRHEVIKTLVKAQRISFLTLLAKESFKVTSKQGYQVIVIADNLAKSYKDLFNKTNDVLLLVSNSCVSEQAIGEQLEQLALQWNEFAKNVAQELKAKEYISSTSAKIQQTAFEVMEESLSFSLAQCENFELQQEFEKIQKESSGSTESSEKEERFIESPEEGITAEQFLEDLAAITGAEKQSEWSYWDYVPYFGTKNKMVLK